MSRKRIISSARQLVFSTSVEASSVNRTNQRVISNVNLSVDKILKMATRETKYSNHMISM